MRVIYDWRLARVIDSNSVIIDEIKWQSVRTISSVSGRMEDLQRGRVSPEAKVLMSRFPDSRPDPDGHLENPDWPPLSSEEEDLLSEVAVKLARNKVARSAGDPDRRLDMLVTSQIELRAAYTTVESRCVEWAGLLLPVLDLDGKRDDIPSVLSNSENIGEAAEKLETETPPFQPSQAEWLALKELSKRCQDIKRTLESSEASIRLIAEDYLPSLSKLVGPLGAAKMCVLAGSRERLARMPSGSIQVLGAHAAMAAHRRGAPPPKHGSVIFSMPQISRSPRWVRGKIARFIAGKASIATRIDHFNGETLSDEEVYKIHKKSEEIRDKFPRPPKKR